jgi:hypothetical protein
VLKLGVAAVDAAGELPGESRGRRLLEDCIALFDETAEEWELMLHTKVRCPEHRGKEGGPTGPQPETCYLCALVFARNPEAKRLWRQMIQRVKTEGRAR